jgi:hypothetical protein
MSVHEFRDFYTLAKDGWRLSRAGNCDYHNNSGCGTVFRIAAR